MSLRGSVPLAVLLCCTVIPECAGDDHWPPQVPEPAGWTYETSAPGKSPAPLRLANATVEYALYSSPQHPMLYGLSNYTVKPRRRTGYFDRQRPIYRTREVVVWMQGQRGEPLRIFVRTSHRRAFFFRGWAWTELPPRSEEWTNEQGAVLRLWSVHALVRSHSVDAKRLQF